MIMESMLEKPLNLCSTRTLVWWKCDYCENPFQRTIKDNKRLNKNINKDSCGNCECSNKKREEISILKFGTTSIFESQQFKDTLEKSNLSKHGVKHYYQSEEFKNKRKQKLIERFGCDSPLKNLEIQDRQKKTCCQTYGVENYSQIEGYVDKVRAINQEKYGVDNVMQLQEFIDKKNNTCSNRFGKINYTQTDEYWENRKKNTLEETGYEHTSQVPGNRKKAAQTQIERYGDLYCRTNKYKDDYVKLCMEKWGVPNPLCLKENRLFGKTQQELQEWINSLGYSFKEDYSILDGKEIDLYDSEKKIAIEFCGLYWHNEFSPTSRLKHYHYDKYIGCKNKEIKLITIFEDEWKHKNKQCKGILRSIIGNNDVKIYARKCKLINLSKQQFNEFAELYHIQGKSGLGKCFFGLTHNDELVACMSLGRHHRVNNSLTLDRLVFKSGVQVIGGASKMFASCKTWAKDNGYEKITTWSDNRWSHGNVYKILGFTLEDDIPPDYSYVDFKKPNYNRLSKQSCKKSNTGCPKDITEHQWAIEHGLARIWDCGKKRWIINI